MYAIEGALPPRLWRHGPEVCVAERTPRLKGAPWRRLREGSASGGGLYRGGLCALLIHGLEERREGCQFDFAGDVGLQIAPDMEEILTESEIKLDGVRQKILQVAQELSGEDMHQFHRAVTTGLQEYVEAVSFQHFIKTRSLISVEEINKQLTFTTEESKTPSSDGQDKQLVTWRLKITPVDYLLGVADLTGELMRMCINSVGNGDIDTPFEVSQFLRQVYDGFSFIGNTGPYEVSKKLYTLKQSLAKVENACYALKVRGSEIPKHMLADVFSVKTEMIDQEESIS
ncbi:translin-associated protein X-like protein [Cricetulus griseus]|uniref:Translin-associated protein X-like protein n=1 Tax=Cricetulus griseus TaxID=10029 RepID=A0A061IH42_CRIGR|nr:translin-associated protein X-like protein [Cricetulus griseus]